MDGLSDKRSWQLARRLIYMEWPDLLQDTEKEALLQRLRRRIGNDMGEVPWLTVPAAQRELAELLTEIGEEPGPLLMRYEDYLQKLAAEI